VLLFAFLVIDENFGESFYRAMAVLVAASPRALAISTPSAVLSGIARAARGGVLVKAAGPSRTSASWAPSPSTRPARSPRASRG
jgi:Cd2+/Zn2+-exporting ATPase